MPAPATMVTSGSWCAAMNASITGSIVFVSALFPSNADTMSGNPSWLAGQQPDRDLRLQTPLLRQPALPEPPPASAQTDWLEPPRGWGSAPPGWAGPQQVENSFPPHASVA